MIITRMIMTLPMCMALTVHITGTKLQRLIVRHIEQMKL